MAVVHAQKFTMSQALATHPAGWRSQAILSAIPAICFIGSVVWMAVGGFGWLFAGMFFGGSLTATAICVAILSPIGIFLTARVARLAVDAELALGE